MAVVNIPRDVKDQFYRYKMPAIIAKVEGRGNGIKTVVVNMTDVAKSLERPPSYITKYFGFELGAIATIDPVKDRYVVNGKHDQSKLASVLDAFIEKFVLCKLCTRNPETKMVISGGSIELRCKACGGIAEVDMRHKLTAFILKNPPDNSADKSAKKSTSKSKKSKKGKESEDEGDPEEDFEIEAKKQAAEVKKVEPVATKKKKKEDDEIVWFTDTSKEAAEQRRKQMLDNEFAAKVFVSDKGPDSFSKLTEFVATNPTNDKLIEEFEKVRISEKWNDEQTAAVVVECLFNKDILKQLKTPKVDVLEKFVGNTDAQKGVLGSVVEIVSGKDTDIKLTPHILKALYDLDILDEETIIAWSDSKKTPKKVKDTAQVFVDWLKNAEVEGESDEGDEDDDEEDDEDEEEGQEEEEDD